MSHDIEAAWVSAEIAANFRSDPRLWFSSPLGQGGFSVYASSEPRRLWPISDGLINIEIPNREMYNVAVEYKTENEGLHGILTGLGQAHAYLHKGFNGAVVAIPERYESHDTPGGHLVSIIEETAPRMPIGVFTYEEFDPSAISPFHGKLSCLRNLDLDLRSVRIGSTEQVTPRITTQWGHVREGSTEPHAFYCYLKTAKELPSRSNQRQGVHLPRALVAACNNIDPNISVFKYLSYSVGDTFHDKVWRMFWFTYVLNRDTVDIWRKTSSGEYEVNPNQASIQTWSGTPKNFFVGRSDSIKNRLVDKLNNGEITEGEAWEQYAKKVRARAHSYREDIDSGLVAFGFLEPDGKPSNLGYKFVDACERTDEYNTGIPRAIFGAALLNNANFGALLHYIFKSSEKKFSRKQLAFTKKRSSGSLYLDRAEYLEWLEDQLANKLGVMRKVSERGGQARKAFQAEFALMRHLGLIQGYRIGVGIEINWPKVQEFLQFPF